MAYDETELRLGLNGKLRAEVDVLLTDAVFRRSPTLSRLLRYLVEETVAGRSGSLKSFTVAVDGLGRPGDFDATTDSSARVQMVRLRKTLENHYAQHGPLDELCIYLLPGCYTVRLGRLAVAYPMLYRPLSDTDAKPAVQAAPPADAVPEYVAQPVPADPAKPLYRRYPIISAFTLLGAAAGVAMILFFQQVARPKNPQLSPVLELMPVDSGGRPELVKTARFVGSTFATDLPRFKLSRVRVVDKGEGLYQPNDRENAYRMFSRLEADEAGGNTLYVTIDDSRTGTMLWSREMSLPTGQQAMSGALIPLLGEINGPMGIIATHGTIITKDRNDGGYPCLLKYFAFSQTRESAIEDKVAACFEKPVKEQHVAATILAARALFAIERRSALKDFESASQIGIQFARAAVAADPMNGAANFALARFSYLRKDCVSARFYTARTMETNPNGPMSTATLAALAGLCNYRDADKLLDQAFRTQSTFFPKGRILLVLAALGQNRPDKIAEILPSDLPQSRYNRVNYYLAETLIAASQGRRDDAVRNWRLFSQIAPPGNRTPDEKLRQIVALPAMRQKLIAYLRAAGVILES